MKTLEELGISPAPWKACKFCPAVTSINAEEVCDLSNSENIDADARLIAAAPELYECLRYCVKFIGNAAEPLGADCETVEMIAKAKVALAKAGGEAK